jgi:hypothetical protein
MIEICCDWITDKKADCKGRTAAAFAGGQVYNLTKNALSRSCGRMFFEEV